MSHDIYLDANATSPILPAAASAALDAMNTCFGNPSSSHAAGLRAKALLDGARARARRVLGAGSGRLLFTSGATEGIQAAVLSALCAIRARRAAGEICGDLLVVGATEHKAVSESLAHWNGLLGTNLTVCPLEVDAQGRHRLDLLRTMAPRAAMVCTMAANNETGVVSDLDGIAGVLREHAPQAYWMVDCVQALGKLPLDLAATRIDYAPFSGHKLYAPKGIGMLYVREGAPYTPLMIGGGQEAGLRSGTENMAGIAALDAVLATLEEGATFRSHAEMAAMRARLAASLREAFPGIVFNAPLEHTLPTTLNFAVPGMPGKDLLDLFDAAGMRVSAGSACSAAKAAPSHVLQAMGLPPECSSGAVRLSFGALATDDFIDEACARILRCGRAARIGALVPLGAADAHAHAHAHAQAGVLQLSDEGRHGWLVFDAQGSGGACVAIDPPAALAQRIAVQVRARGLRMAAVLGTGPDPDGGRAALRRALGLDEGDPGPLGWPDAGLSVRLDDGAVPALPFGGELLARLAHAGGASAAYLLGGATDGQLPGAAVRLAFVGVEAARCASVLGRHVDARTVLCLAADEGGAPCTLSVPAPGDCGAADAALDLEPGMLAPYLDRHEDALLIDVREAFEAAAADGVRLHGRAARHMPLSRLAEHLGFLLAAPGRPLVFVCRSGKRSARAALCLRRLGHPQAWSLAGGLALGGL